MALSQRMSGVAHDDIAKLKKSKALLGTVERYLKS